MLQGSADSHSFEPVLVPPGAALLDALLLRNFVHPVCPFFFLMAPHSEHS